MRYRPEIDGLRALAVMSVIFFHAGFQAYSGGYVGVDIFFVISGYLITSVIQEQSRTGTFSLLKFYENRARRILPALYFVILVCLPFTWFWLLPRDMKGFTQSLTAVSAFVPNFFFWLQAGYFNQANDLKPLLHTWSLGVEEQFYFLFPLLFLTLSKYGNRLLVSTLIALALLSLLAAQSFSVKHPAFGFYQLPTRGWELLIGAVLALGLPSAIDGHRRLREILSVAGILLIAYAIVRFDSRTPFPSVYALVPTLGTAILIACATGDTTVGRLLGWKPLVSVGLISYSAYLWHQPLFALARHRSTEPLSQATFVMLVLTVLLFAFLSWKYIEVPFRKAKAIGRRTLLVFFLAFSAFFVVFGFLGHITEGFPGREPQIASILSVRTTESSRCMNAPNTVDQLALGDACTMGQGISPIMAVIGDSHAGAIFDVLDAYAKKAALSFYAVASGFCAPITNGFRMNRYAPECPAKTQAFIEFAVNSPQVKYVVLFAEWAYYVKGFREEGDNKKPQEPLFAIDRDQAARTVEDNARIFARSLQITVDTILKAGKKVIIIDPVPEFHKAVMPTILKGVRFGESVDILSHAPVISLAEYRERNAEVLAVLEDMANVTRVDSSSLFCKDEVCASVGADRKILYSDTNHVTEYGAHLLVEQLMKVIR